MDVAILTFEGISPFAFAAAYGVFAEAAPPELGIRTRLVRSEGRQLDLVGGPAIFHAAGAIPVADAVNADLLLVPSWPDPAIPSPPDLTDCLRARSAAGKPTAGLCLGAFGLGHAGILDGFTATTHWVFADQFAALFPKIAVDETALFVDEGPVITSAGMAAATDCCLFLMRRGLGAAAANDTARRLVTPPHREGGQAQFIHRPLPQLPVEQRLRDFLERVATDPARAPDTDEAAASLGVSRRGFTRHFRGATGVTYTRWLEDRRLRMATELLEGTRLSISAVTQHAGFQSESRFREVFRGRYGVAPTAWRRTFQAKGPQGPNDERTVISTK